jgi:PAS domain S-box-containing protein
LDGTERLYTVEGDKRFEAEESRSEYEPAAEVPAALADHPHLDLQDWIASGGLAHIYTACEAPFGRKVALKWQRGALEAEDPIIREGVVTGYLDHPNIVPVYRLVEDGEGTTMVMKHIEGRSLADLWDEQAEELSETEHLREGLEVLIEVCQALEYAHSRGIIHRDLKPRNVMVGDLGEVYVIDWGLAAYIGDEDPAADIPVAGNEESLFGTPAYMAPEMVEAEPEKLSTATDQYMLGGLVHYLITDEIPHSGSRPTEILASAYRADPPEYGDEVPDELGAIVRRAMASEPSARFPGMAALRLALESFLEHEHSRRLVDRTHQAASELRKHIGKQEAEEVDVAKIYEKFGKARFGYREALETWPNNDRALEGLQELLEMGARWTLDQGMAEAAMLFLREMPDPPEALRAEVRQLRDEVDAQRRAGLFFEQSPHAVAVVDEQGEITSCNERLVEMFGYDSDALLGEPIECLMPERYRDHHRHHRAVYAEAPEGRPMGTDLELRGLHEDGTEFPIDIRAQPGPVERRHACDGGGPAAGFRAGCRVGLQFALLAGHPAASAPGGIRRLGGTDRVCQLAGRRVDRRRDGRGAARGVDRAIFTVRGVGGGSRLGGTADRRRRPAGGTTVADPDRRRGPGRGAGGCGVAGGGGAVTVADGTEGQS